MTLTIAHMGDQDTAGSVSSIAKVARVLRALATTDGRNTGVTQIAVASALPKSTAHRILSELIHEGLVAHSGSKYQLGPGWFLLQGALSSSQWMWLVDRAQRPLASLFERTRATVHLAVLHNGQVLYLEKLTASGGTVVPTRVGARMPATCTAVGKVLLAHDADALERVLARPLPVSARGSITAPGLLHRQLDKIRRDGLAFEHEESQAGVHCVAAPIFHDGGVVAAVSVTRVGGHGLEPNDAHAARRAASEIECWLEDC